MRTTLRLAHAPSFGRHGALALLLCGSALVAGCLPDSTNAPRPPAALPAAADMAGGGTGETLIDVDGGTKLAAIQIFQQQLLPLISPTCRGCHGGRVGDLGPPFMASSNPNAYDPYQTMKTWRNFVPDIAEQSLFITRGPHEGPALDLDQTEIALRWLRQEKVERDLQVKPTTRPQTKPFFPVTNGTTLNVIELGSFDTKLTGARIQFTAKVNPNIRGISITDLRILNLPPPGAVEGDQRTIRIQRPIIIVWSNGVPQPDPGDSLGSFDRTIKLKEDDKNAPAGSGILVTPLLTLPIFDVGDAMSFAFNIANTVGTVISPDTCRTAGLQAFTATGATDLKAYFSATKSCTQAKCHDNVTAQVGMDFTALKNFVAAGNPVDYSSVIPLCESVKFFRKTAALYNNLDAVKPAANNHRFRFGVHATGNGCTDNGFPADCWTTVKAKLDAWAAVDP